MIHAARLLPALALAMLLVGAPAPPHVDPVLGAAPASADTADYDRQAQDERVVYSFTFIDIFIVVAVGVVAFLMVNALRNRSSDEDEEADREEASEAYRRAAQAWDLFRSDESRSRPREEAEMEAELAEHGPDYVREPGASLPQGFDADEFLKGAKMVFNRVTESWAERDMDDIREFTTDAMYEEFETRAHQETRPAGSAEVLYLKAKLLEAERSDDGTTTASVMFEATVRKGKNDQEEVREVWHFTKGPGPKDNWLIASIEPVH